MARYLLGEEIFSIYAVGGCLIDPAIGSAGDIDTAMITLKSRSGRFMQMNNCRRAAFGYDQRLEAVCSTEVLSVGNSLQNTLTIADSAGFHTARRRITSSSALPRLTDWRWMPSSRYCATDSPRWPEYATASKRNAWPKRLRSHCNAGSRSSSVRIGYRTELREPFMGTWGTWG